MKIESIAVSKRKGTRKQRISNATVIESHGIRDDAHAGGWHRQISFLSAESIDEARLRGMNVSFGDFAENIATSGVDWKDIPVGTCLKLGNDVLVEITQIGKECHRKCAVYYQTGDCIMPREGIFAKVLTGGEIRCGDSIEIVSLKEGEF